MWRGFRHGRSSFPRRQRVRMSRLAEGGKQGGGRGGERGSEWEVAGEVAGREGGREGTGARERDAPLSLTVARARHSFPLLACGCSRTARRVRRRRARAGEGFRLGGALRVTAPGGCWDWRRWPPLPPPPPPPSLYNDAAYGRSRTLSRSTSTANLAGGGLRACCCNLFYSRYVWWRKGFLLNTSQVNIRPS